MLNTGKLAGRTIFITGASRGIGKEIALKCAKDGANIVVAAKSVTENPKMPGTIYSAAEEIEKAGGKAFPVAMDVRDEASVESCVKEAAQKFGGIDILINNASAITLTPVEKTEIKRYDLMHQVNVRGTFITSKHCIQHLKKSESGGKILNNSPPLVMNPRWFAPHVAYTMTKYGMSMCVLGMAEELKAQNIAVNALWPKTWIHTAATEMLAGDADLAQQSSRKPSIMADAAYAILTKPNGFSGNFCIDEEVLKAEGITDFDQYACIPGKELILDGFLPDKYYLGQEKLSPTKQCPKSLDVVFDRVKGLLDEEVVAKTNGLFVFKISGGAQYFIDLRTGAGSVGKGQPSEKADVTFTANEESLLHMFAGKLKPTNAFMTGKLKIQGDMGRAMKLEKLMGQMKGKL